MKYQSPTPEIEGAASMSLTCLQWLYRQARSMKNVAEIGSYKGRSTHALLSGCSGPVFAIDHWIMPTGRLAGQFRARTFEEFKQNLASFANLEILQMASLEAVGRFRDGSVDMVFIDGDHSYEGVMADIRAWLPKVRRLLCGHDYHAVTPGVMQAVEEVFAGRFYVVPKTNIWAVKMDKEDGADKEKDKSPDGPPQDRMVKRPPVQK